MANIYFSVQSKLAHSISEDYYNNRFYVIIYEDFDGDKTAFSSPKQEYELLYAIANSNVRNSSVHETVKRRILSIARIQRRSGVINDKQLGEIEARIDTAKPKEFTPFIYLIKQDLVQNRVMNEYRGISVGDRPTEQLILTDLMPGEFEILTGL